MGPKKETLRKENLEKAISIEDPINTEDWRCAVVMAVERSSSDTFILKEFMEEASNGRRREVNLISYEHLILKLLNDFSNGQLSYKYAFLINFTQIFEEAAEYLKNKTVIPLNLLAKVVKALLFYFREDSIQKIEKKNMGPQDSVKVMAERPFNFNGNVQGKGMATNAAKKNEAPTTIKGKMGISNQDGGIKIRPPSPTKEETKLLKRGEGAKASQCIDDAPSEGFFKMYVLLIGFYFPDFPVELVKAQVPLHGVFCIDSTLSGIKRITSSTYGRIQNKNSQPKSAEINNFWNEFLNILWNPQFIIFFKEIVFQVYTPQKFLCEKKKLRELIYKEISYLMYDLSDYKRQHINYLNNLKLWQVKDSTEKIHKLKLDSNLKECATVPLVLWHILNEICGESDPRGNKDSRRSVSTEESDSEMTEIESSGVFTQSLMENRGNSMASPPWSEIVFRLRDSQALAIHSRVKNLDLEYLLDTLEMKPFVEDQDDDNEKKPSTTCCRQSREISAENIEEAICSGYGFSRPYWKKLRNHFDEEHRSFPVPMDYYLYSFLISKIVCPHQSSELSSTEESSVEFLKTYEFLNKISNFAIIDNIGEEMQKPHFSVTESSRNVLKRIPYSLKKVNQNFFCSKRLKIVSPDRVRASSTPDFRDTGIPMCNLSFVSDLAIPQQLMNRIDWNVYENLNDFIENDMLPDLNGFDFVEELSGAKLLAKEQQYRDEFNCVDCSYSILTDSLLVIIHNRKNIQNSFHEAFNNRLKNKVGLRDFFEYVLEDEAQWFAAQEVLRKNNFLSTAEQTVVRELPNVYVDSDFWLENSIKYRESLAGKNGFTPNVKKERDEMASLEKGSLNSAYLSKGTSNAPDDEKRETAQPFEGYDLDELAIQFSGMKTTHFADDCSITSELNERLYGKQELGVHIRQGGHTLHLYSYVCPEPHILQPFTYHLTCNNGIIVAFGKRMTERKITTSSEITEAKITTSKTKKKSSSQEPPIESETIIDFIKNEEDFPYNLKLSLPNGMILEILRDPNKSICYVKQRHMNDRCETLSGEAISNETSRLFLPDGSLVKMMRDGTFQILKANASTLIASVKDIVTKDAEAGGSTLLLANYEKITPKGRVITVDRGQIISSTNIQIFQFSDLEMDRKFFRRSDGTNYIIESGGRLCVDFADGTKMSHKPILREEIILLDESEDLHDNVIKKETESADDSETRYVIIYEEIVIEHPNYATIVYNSFTKEWKIILPFDTTVVANEKGEFQVEMDARTKLKIKKDFIEMNRFSNEQYLTCNVKVDLTVFNGKNPSGTYCKMKSSSGETYVVEANSNHYLLLPSKDLSGAKSSNDINPSISSEVERMKQCPFDCLTPNECHHQVEEKEIKASMKKKKIFSKDEKYLVVRKNLTGFEMISRMDLEETLAEMRERSILYTRKFAGLRCFVLIGPEERSKDLCKLWQMETTLPDLKTDVLRKPKQKSSIYGVPPSWMHPFPKRKTPFSVPELLTCRVFAEIKKTDFSPPKTRLDCGFCDFPNPDSMVLHPEISDINTIDEYANLFLKGDQEFLKKAYIQASWEMAIQEKNKKVDGGVFERVLTALKHDIELQEEHKRAIRFHLVPKYFNHAEGICWLILDGLLRDGKFDAIRKARESSTLADVTPKSPKSSSTFSKEEIEYDLKWSPERSFSDLSCLTNISSKTAPAELTQGHPDCKIEAKRNAASAPVIKMLDENGSDDNNDMTIKGICFLEDEDAGLEANLNSIKKTQFFEDLLRLGLI